MCEETRRERRWVYVVRCRLFGGGSYDRFRTVGSTVWYVPIGRLLVHAHVRALFFRLIVLTTDT